MSDADPILDDIALALTALAGRLDALEKGQEAIARAIHQDRDMQRQTLALLIQFLERQNESLKRLEGKMGEMTAVRRQATVKSQVVLTKPQPKPAPKPVVSLKPVPKPQPPPPPPPQPLPVPEISEEVPLPEIEQQISEAIGNISAMLKKKETRKRKGV